MERLTDILEVVGMLFWVAAAAVAAFVFVPAPWSLPAALAVTGSGLLFVSLLVTDSVAERRTEKTKTKVQAR